MCCCSSPSWSERVYGWRARCTNDRCGLAGGPCSPRAPVPEGERGAERLGRGRCVRLADEDQLMHAAIEEPIGCVLGVRDMPSGDNHELLGVARAELVEA